ncbi:hypothetical protein GDO81_011745 [Engystomops pustulosus]|uniref:thioredoxin-dependent peroxiredoxin n=1 Tax=Engystomops pustulosus TaxID=76066 RepID=A0AAV7BGC4_ENGPU|nr:hypothetical protein GDO81_011745 [Engystomops pustulosus]
MSAGNAKILNLPLDFNAKALMSDVQLKDLKLADYIGKSSRSCLFEVIGASVYSHFSHLAWTNARRNDAGLGNMKIPLVSDLQHKIAKDYGVLKEDESIAFRSLFIVDNKGILRQITVNDLPVGCSVDKTMWLGQAFQHTDKYGEVCPAGWKPGSDTIKPEGVQIFVIG